MFFCSGSGSPGWRTFSVDLVEARSAGSVVEGSPSILELDERKPLSSPPPQPAARPAAARDRTLRVRAIGRVLVMGAAHDRHSG
jgi:hypothetical protein